MARRIRFVGSDEQLDELLDRVKLFACPHCGRTGTLIGHGLLRGYAERDGQPVVRGRRLFCSNRFRRPGCGRTFSVLLAQVLRGFVVRARTLFVFIAAVVSGVTRAAAWKQAAAGALSVASGYRLWRRFAEAQSHMRTTLTALCAPPASPSSAPWAQLLAHLEHVWPSAVCPFAEFQKHFQVDLLG